jgi:hypothetical protein
MPKRPRKELAAADERAAGRTGGKASGAAGGGSSRAHGGAGRGGRSSGGISYDEAKELSQGIPQSVVILTREPDLPPELSTLLLQTLCRQEAALLAEVAAARAGEVADAHARAAESDAVRQEAMARLERMAAEDVAAAVLAAASSGASSPAATTPSAASQLAAGAAARPALSAWGGPELPGDVYAAAYEAVSAQSADSRRAGSADRDPGGDGGVAAAATSDRAEAAASSVAAATAAAGVAADVEMAGSQPPAPIEPGGVGRASDSAAAGAAAAGAWPLQAPSAPSEAAGPTYHGRPLHGYTHGALYLSAEGETGFPPRKRAAWRYCVERPGGPGEAGEHGALDPKALEDAREVLKAPAFPDRVFPSRGGEGGALARAVALAAAYDEAALEEGAVLELHRRALAAVSTGGSGGEGAPLVGGGAGGGGRRALSGQ